jgi:hypothetical protein
VNAPTIKLEVTHWPYGLSVEVVDGGLLLRPRRKARAGWTSRLRKMQVAGDLKDIRQIQNEFDKTGWEW